MMKIAIVTGANSGLGLETTKALYLEGYSVILACPEKKKTLHLIEEIKTNRLNTLEFIQLDLKDHNSILEFSKEFMRKYTHLDLLVNNAGLMEDEHIITNNGLELHFDVNYMGHFYLTYLLYDCFSFSKEPKIVTVTSLAHNSKNAQIYFDDINFHQDYKPFTAYAQSKLACALFGYQLRKSTKIKSIIVHPGASNTNINKSLPKWIHKLINPFIRFMPVSSAAEGAQNIVYACLDPNLETGSYIGPQGFKKWIGKPGIEKLSNLATDDVLGQKLWTFSEEHLHINFEL